jgi:hypothetical protein
VGRVAMLSIHAGYDIAYLTDAVGTGGVDYYLSAAEQGGEPEDQPANAEKLVFTKLM